REAKTWQVTIPALGDRPLQARVRELSPVADPASRTYPMRLSLLGDTGAVALGMSATARALRDSGETIVLPISALYSQDGKARVWVVADDMSVQPVPVQTGGYLDDAVRITGGLKAGDRVVTARANLLVAGQKVRLLDGERGEVAANDEATTGNAETGNAVTGNAATGNTATVRSATTQGTAAANPAGAEAAAGVPAPAGAGR